MKNLAHNALLINLLATVIFSPAFAFSQSKSEEPRPFNISEHHNQDKKTASGKWGQIDYFPIMLEPTDSRLKSVNLLKKWTTDTVWRFDAKDAPEVQRILIESSIPPELAARLASPRFLSKNEPLNWMEIVPPDDVILGLTPSQRKALYPRLMPRDSSNLFFRPVTLPTGGIETVSNISTGLPEAQDERIKKLSFTDGRVIRLSDIQLLMRHAKDDTERLQIFRCISRQSSLSVRLQLPPKSDAKSLANYWEAGGKNRELTPLLESVIRTSGVNQLDLIHLLPSVPRTLLHTYPSSAGKGLGSDLPDCFWTAFGFFAETPPDRHLDFIGRGFNQRYERAVEPLQFGDLVLIHEKNVGTMSHACNYLAGDLVFTKNGISTGRPWIVSTLRAVADKYVTENGIQISFHRLKPGYLK